jgi:hypothetical protein
MALVDFAVGGFPVLRWFNPHRRQSKGGWLVCQFTFD